VLIVSQRTSRPNQRELREQQMNGEHAFLLQSVVYREFVEHNSWLNTTSFMQLIVRAAVIGLSPLLSIQFVSNAVQCVFLCFLSSLKIHLLR